MRTKTSFKKLISLLVMIALPVAFQNLLTTTGSMVDTIMLGTLGENTVGGVGLCAQFSTLIFAGYWGFIGGGALFIGQYWGARDHDGICISYGMTLAFCSITMIISTYMALFQPEVIMQLYTDSEEIQKIGITYLQIVGFAYPFQVLAAAMAVLLRSIEQVKIPLIAGFVEVIANVILNYIFIFGKLGFSPMGVQGAALATVFSSVINVLMIVLMCLRAKIPYILELRRHWRFQRAVLRDYLKKSFPIILNEIFIGIGNMMVNVVLGHQINEAIAATAVFRTLEGLILGFFSGFSSAATVLVGKEVGAGDHEEAFSRGWRIIYLCQVMTLMICLILVLAHAPLLHAMGLSGTSFNLAYGMLLIYTIAGTIRMGNWAQNDTFRAAGNSAYGSVLELSFMFLLVQPTIHLANDYFHAPFLPVFALCYIDEPIRYFLMQKRMYSGRWIRPISASGLATIEEFRTRHGISE